MTNPPNSAGYGMIANGVQYWLILTFDAQWNLVNSSMNDAAGHSFPITGSYNPATGQITFVERLTSPWPVASYSFPSYMGYLTSIDQFGREALFAGIYDEITVVRSGPPPGPFFIWERVEHGWWAIQGPQ
jgi:hypothetical protein